MVRRICSVLILSVSLCFSAVSGARAQPQRPKLLVGLVVDQMRWDYLYRYADRYSADGGFRRILTQGFSNENTFIPYAPTVTACGHASIYTGSTPAVHGITGNAWYDNHLNRVVYCTEDKKVKTVGSTSTAGEMSPANLLASTIGDELKLATNFRSKVIGIALKDRGAILPAGHAANGAYWYDGRTGNWVTSTYYRNDLPAWVSDFNASKMVDKYYQQGWSTLYPLNTYVNSTADEKEYEGKPFGTNAKGFPYDLKGMIGKNYGAIATTPHGNTMTLALAKAALKAEELGRDEFTDLLAVSLSSPDYVGHTFGPNSIEAEDIYLRLDKELGEFFNFLDKEVGKGQYLFFISADHGVAHVPGFMKENKIPSGLFDDTKLVTELNGHLGSLFGQQQLVLSIMSFQVHLNHKVIDSLKMDESAVSAAVIKFLKKRDDVARAFELEKVAQTTLPAKIKDMVTLGYQPVRSGDIQILIHPAVYDGGPTGTGHGVWNPYDAHIPLVWYGWKIPAGKSNHEVYMTDIAPTIAALLQIQMPNGCLGKPIEAITR